VWRLLYSAWLYLLLPAALARVWWRGRREPGYRRRLGERFARYREAVPTGQLIWLHAVSVGEARASAGLVRGLAARGFQILATCTTAAGHEALKELHGERVRIAWLPYDTPAAVRRFLEHFRPRLGVLVETEIWPNLLATCRSFGVPLLLANARLSEKSAAGYRRWRGLMAPALAALDAVCAQAEADAARLRDLGAGHVEVAGNLKFDSTPDERKSSEGRAWKAGLGRPVLLLASTREGEERLLLDQLPPWDGRLLVVVVPRHPRRFDEVAALAQSRRSAQPAPAAQDRVHLGDSMGEMDFYYGAADVAIIGGSFVPLGGQNLIEACAAGVPVVMGPSAFNFAEPTRLAVEAGAAVQVADAAGAVSQAMRLLADAEARGKMGAAGRALSAAHRGATERHLERCAALLEGRAGPTATAPARD
jgi:3-deoxy-D-manno-octulosonic-acid transferase